MYSCIRPISVAFKKLIRHDVISFFRVPINESRNREQPIETRPKRSMFRKILMVRAEYVYRRNSCALAASSTESLFRCLFQTGRNQKERIGGLKISKGNPGRRTTRNRSSALRADGKSISASPPFRYKGLVCEEKRDEVLSTGELSSCGSGETSLVEPVKARTLRGRSHPTDG